MTLTQTLPFPTQGGSLEARLAILRPDGPQGGKFVAEIEPQQIETYVEILQQGLIGQALIQALKIAGVLVVDGSSV